MTLFLPKIPTKNEQCIQKVMIFDNPGEVIDEIFDWLLSRYQIALGTQMIGSNFIFDCVNLIYYKCHKTNFKHVGSYIDFPDWMKKR